MRDVPRTPTATLLRARRIAHDAGVEHVYLGNVRVSGGATTHCLGCGTVLIDREGYEVTGYRLTATGDCPDCGRHLPGIWDPQGPPPPTGQWYPRRVRV